MTVRRERIAVTGVGMVTALGMDATRTFERLIQGERAIFPVRVFDPAGARSDLAAEVVDLAPMRAITGEELSRTDALALIAAREALAASGLEGRDRVGLSVGGTVGGMLSTEADLLGRKAGERWVGRAQRMLTHPLSTTVEVLSREIGPFQPTATLCSACSSGAVALVEAAHLLSSGQARAVLAGGADGLCRLTFAGFNALSATDRGPCRPFDRERDGLTLGEGAAFLVLELESVALRRKARRLALLSGWAVGAEAHHITRPEGTAARAIALLRGALESAGLLPSDLDYVNLHGTGTRANDAMEARAMLGALGPEASRVFVSSSKGQLGHTLGAAGAVEAVITVLALDQGRLPPTVGLRTPEVPELRHVTDPGGRARLRAALSSSFGFGGMDVVLAFEKAPDDTGSGPAPMAGVRSEPDQVVVSAAVLLGEGGSIETELRDPGASGTSLDPLAALAPERSRRFDRQTAWATRAIEEGLRQAGLGPRGVGLVLGSAYGAVERSLSFLARVLEQGMRAAPPAEFPHLVQSAAAGNASVYLGLTGPVMAVSERAQSGVSALEVASAFLELGIAPAVVAGALSARDPVVEELDPSRHGVGARGEGGGFLVLELFSALRARGRGGVCRLVSHRRVSAAELVQALAPPRSPTSAALVLGAFDPVLERCVRDGGWAEVARHRPRDGFHEAMDGAALALGALLLARGASEVLVVSGSAERAALTRLEPIGGVS